MVVVVVVLVISYWKSHISGGAIPTTIRGIGGKYPLKSRVNKLCLGRYHFLWSVTSHQQCRLYITTSYYLWYD